MEKSVTAEELDRRFDNGEDITEYLDLDSARLLKSETRRVNVDFPGWMLEELDREAARLGVPRQAVIKFIIDTHFKAARDKNAA